MLLSNVARDGKTLVKSLTKGSEKKVLVKCDMCGKESWIMFCSYNRSQIKKGNTGIVHCKKCACIESGKIKTGKKIGPRKKELIKVGSKHPSWCGGDWINSGGYKVKYVGVKKYKLEHRYVIEQSIGRELKRKEVVHHINCNKLDNRIENLFLCSSESEHRKLHNSENKIMQLLLESKLVTFKNGEYKMAQVKLHELLERPGEENQQPSQ